MRDISFVLELNMSGIKIGEENAYITGQMFITHLLEEEILGVDNYKWNVSTRIAKRGR